MRLGQAGLSKTSVRKTQLDFLARLLEPPAVGKADAAMTTHDPTRISAGLLMYRLGMREMRFFSLTLAVRSSVTGCRPLSIPKGEIEPGEECQLRRPGVQEEVSRSRTPGPFWNWDHQAKGARSFMPGLLQDWDSADSTPAIGSLWSGLRFPANFKASRRLIASVFSLRSEEKLKAAGRFLDRLESLLSGRKRDSALLNYRFGRDNSTLSLATSAAASIQSAAPAKAVRRTGQWRPIPPMTTASSSIDGDIAAQCPTISVCWNGVRISSAKMGQECCNTRRSYAALSASSWI